jgi:hypothetical protein
MKTFFDRACIALLRAKVQSCLPIGEMLSEGDRYKSRAERCTLKNRMIFGQGGRELDLLQGPLRSNLPGHSTGLRNSVVVCPPWIWNRGDAVATKRVSHRSLPLLLLG